MRNDSKYLHDLKAFAVRYDREVRAHAGALMPDTRPVARALRPDLADHPTVRAMRARAARRASLRIARARDRAQEFARALTDDERAWFRGRT